jgi:hypothetical protein
LFPLLVGAAYALEQNQAIDHTVRCYPLHASGATLKDMRGREQRSVWILLCPAQGAVINGPVVIGVSPRDFAGLMPSKAYWNQAVAFDDLRVLGVVDRILESAQISLNRGQMYSIPHFPLPSEREKDLLRIFPDIPHEWIAG